MNEVAHLIQTITPGNWGIILTLLAFGSGWAMTQWKENRKLTTAERLAKREGFTAQVELLLNENRALLNDMHQLRIEYDNHRKLCYHETEQLRGMVIALQNEVEGLKRRATQDALEIAHLKGAKDEG